MDKRIWTAAVTLALSGCAGPSAKKMTAQQAPSRPARRVHAAAPQRTREELASRAAALKLGISPDQARLALGEPLRSRRLTNLDGVFDTLEYDRKNLLFKNDRLIQIRDTP